MTAVGVLATGFLLLIPFAVTPAYYDRFRVLKECLSRTEGIVFALLLVVTVALLGTERLRILFRERALVLTICAALVWALITTIASTHHAHSIESVVTFVTTLLVFFGVWYAAPRTTLVVFDVLVPVVLLNTMLLALQEYGVYQPFVPDPANPHHMNTTGLIDNPNVAGAYLTLVAIVLLVAAIEVRGIRRFVYAIGVAGAVSGVVISQTRTALIALAAGVIAVAAIRSLKAVLTTGAVALVIIVAGTASKLPAFTELVELPGRLRTAGLEAATSGRIGPVLAGWEMFRDRPLTGVGPGAFKFQYMPYKVRAMEKYPQLLRGTTGTNFGEAHNDHVQLLAETGIPGYLLFLTAVVLLVRTSLRGERADARARVVRALAVPLAATLLVLALAQFPLYVAVTRHLLVTVAGLCAGWSRT